jgi:hypothetical protein
MRSLFVVFTSVWLLTACANTTEVNTITAEIEPPANTEPETVVVEKAEKAMVPSIIFVQFLNQQAPTLLCQQDPGVACLQMPQDLCLASVEASAERCGPKLLESWPTSFEETEVNAVQFSKDYRNCMLNDWVEEYGLQESRLASCGIEIE